MTKVEVVAAISAKTGIKKETVLVTVEALMSTIKETMVKGEAVYLRGFGSFILKKRAQKIGRIISEKKSITIPEHYIPKFKPVKPFKTDVMNNVK